LGLDIVRKQAFGTTCGKLPARSDSIEERLAWRSPVQQPRVLRGPDDGKGALFVSQFPLYLVNQLPDYSHDDLWRAAAIGSIDFSDYLFPRIVPRLGTEEIDGPLSYSAYGPIGQLRYWIRRDGSRKPQVVDLVPLDEVSSGGRPSKAPQQLLSRCRNSNTVG
jgi:hypothetical protein